ncbi:unnamed protein product [Cylindrotheca closterium]|uniref:Protein kinase domain-containing protein n=1 Tax=Cylindrotheca closterium TaxID=2856 RepID=A0AAD2FY95_9STRA|nr:unnamed protein product [Cylindrotheca closterium]
MALRSRSNGDKKDPIPLLAMTEIGIGQMLGQGGFSLVSPVEQIQLNEVYDTSDEQATARAKFASHFSNHQEASSSTGTIPNFVLKTLRKDLPEEEYIKGIIDLAIESEFLSELRHPNIICMTAMANSDPHESGFFFILERLEITLDQKFDHWRKIVGDNMGYWMGPFGYCCAKEKYLYQTWMERISIARDIGNAIYYLHSNRIIYRDLKPDNVGLDGNRQLKLFDFGLAKKITPSDHRDGDDLYLLTGNTGSLRYMAPEVAKGESYNQKVDTYSFGIVFWQICSLQTPYANLTTKTHSLKVILGGQRPKPDRSWPNGWKDLMTRCWDANIVARPEFDEIASYFDEQVEDLQHQEGEVPSRATEIKAKKRRKKATPANAQLDGGDTTIQNGGKPGAVELV